MLDGDCYVGGTGSEHEYDLGCVTSKDFAMHADGLAVNCTVPNSIKVRRGVAVILLLCQREPSYRLVLRLRGRRGDGVP